MLCLFVVCSNKLFQHCRFVFSNRNEDHANNGSNTPSSITLKAARWLLELSSTTKETHTFHSVLFWVAWDMLRFATNKQSFLHQPKRSISNMHRWSFDYAWGEYRNCHGFNFLTEDSFCVANNLSWCGSCHGELNPDKKKQKHKHNEQRVKKKWLLVWFIFASFRKKLSWSGFCFVSKLSQRVCCLCSKTNQQPFHFVSCSLLFCCFVAIQQSIARFSKVFRMMWGVYTVQ